MTKIKDIQEKERLKQPMLIKSLIKGVTQKGSAYASITLQDSTGVIEGKLWDLTAEQEALIAVGTVQEVSCEILRYNNVLQAKIHQVTPVEEGSVDMDDFLISSKLSEEELRKEIESVIASIKNQHYKAILEELMKEFGERFYQYPAATKNHHCFLRGLATHVLGMLKIAEQLCILYPQLSRDLLVSGIIAHDLGKTIELSGASSPEYTIEGKLTGHISIMHGKIMEIAQRCGCEESEEAILLRHCVLSHHGQYEYGSPVLPQIQEAEVLSFIDNLDARLNTLESALDGVEEGSFTPRIYAMEQRSFYKPKSK
ncbi:MAG: 3'-5' exoribonuclease YhaM family protein [Anaerorhabdus sp.]